MDTQTIPFWKHGKIMSSRPIDKTKLPNVFNIVLTENKFKGESRKAPDYVGYINRSDEMEYFTPQQEFVKFKFSKGLKSRIEDIIEDLETFGDIGDAIEELQLIIQEVWAH